MSTTTPLPLAGKSALVTGAARSIGAEIALTVCPFLIESDFSADRFHAHSIEEVISTVKRLYFSS
jgi:NAD(P)-dependent dehydrogenase (short-subunit alcohol dehydrogenase family)